MNVKQISIRNGRMFKKAGRWQPVQFGVKHPDPMARLQPLGRAEWIEKDVSTHDAMAYHIAQSASRPACAKTASSLRSHFGEGGPAKAGNAVGGPFAHPQGMLFRQPAGCLAVSYR